MNRRDFIKTMALMAAGANAAPQQIEAFVLSYEANAPQTTLPLMAINEIWISGMETRSTRVVFDLNYNNEKMSLGLNAFGGVVRWVAPWGGELITPHFTWRITSLEGWDPAVNGFISYIGNDLKRHRTPIFEANGSVS